jgi:cytochrome P450
MNIFPSPEQKLNPFQFYSAMRKFNPVAYDDKNNLWGVFRYHDVQSILGDYTHFSSNPPDLDSNNKPLTEEKRKQIPFSRPSLLKSDPPYHRTLRGVIASAFTPMAIAKLESQIENVTHHLINQVIEKGRMDLISDLAYPLPVTVIAELLGVPVEDRNLFHSWADKLVSSAGGELNDDNISTKNLIHIQTEMDDYFGVIIDKRTEKPQQDLITDLIKTEVDGIHLSREEILAFCTLILLAGHVTTVNLIGNAVYSLLQNPQQLSRLREDKSYSLVPSAIEETLRYRSPVQAVFRISKGSVKVGEQTIQSGQGVIVWLGSANHDESVFPDAETFDISRVQHIHSHLAFGHGIHFCLGAPLARLEGRVVLRTILERLKDLELDLYDGDGSKVPIIKPLPSLFFHGVSELVIRFKPATMLNTDAAVTHT